MSELLHIDLNGKTARVSLRALPMARTEREVEVRTSVGAVERRKMITGLTVMAEPTWKALAEGDPEIAPERAGKLVDPQEISAAYYDPADAEAAPVSGFKKIDIVYAPDGTERERRPHLTRKDNTNDLHPAKAGKRIKTEECLTSFVFRHTLQLAHEDGVQRDFLYQFARDLHEKSEMALVGGGPKGNLPLVTRVGGTAYRAFLYGEIQGDSYKLLLLLSDQELKRPAPLPAGNPAA
jgi:hypothetical protein